MSSDISPLNTSKYEKVRKDSSAQQKNNISSGKVTHKISNASIQAFDNLNQFAEQKRNFNSAQASSPIPTKNTNLLTSKHNTYKLVDSKQASNSLYQSDKKLLDTYARIAASYNRRCPKRLRELAKPKKPGSSDQSNSSANFDLNYRVSKPYGTKTKHTSKELQKK
ncbi:uncharacterized protein LOC109861079 [Pseudomyrmex gracilis]|uniref:uncharacterized protein LOC109861079 n=1 Tax=Pseudomyrmex gracilis TaxID=219809 RepID=UPI000995677E|nr:uncharacterized protein LOC109861079 [Pseudomyrmex gracilis]